MNRKQFVIVLIVLGVLGAIGLGLVWQDIAVYRASGAKIGAKLLPKLKIVDVAQVRLQDAKHEVTLVRQEQQWVVQERGGYPASFQEISDLLIKLAELKVTQSEQVGASLWPRVDLADPPKGEGAGTAIEFKDAAGKPLARLVLGKKVLKKDPMNPLPSAKDGVPAGRYVRVDGAGDFVVVVSDPLEKAVAEPGRWLNREFFKAERIRSLAVGQEGGTPRWMIARTEEWGQWRFAAGGGDLNPSAAVSATNKLSALAFKDVAVNPKSLATGKPEFIVAATYDGLSYAVRLAKIAKDEDYVLKFTVAGELPKKRAVEKGEKPEEKERRDKEFAEARKRLEVRIAAERALAKWAYVIAGSEVEPLLKSRSEMLAQKRGEQPPFPPFGPR